VSPALARTDRLALDELARGVAGLGDVLPEAVFPILVRPVDSNAGEGLGKIDAPAELAAYLGATPGNDFFVSQFVDYRSADGRYRKYRVILMQGKAYLAHLGISSRWMVHYLNADMQDNAANRAEEGEAMQGFDQGFGERHAPAFRVFHERVGLDYLVMDCSETPDGRLLVFEADTCGVVHDMDPEDVYPYKKAQMHKVFAAFQSMLAAQAGRETGA
ncbi:MAG TPA: RimK family alpha-L-glutamate ligase, partial [Bordetella sp.]